MYAIGTSLALFLPFIYVSLVTYQIAQEDQERYPNWPKIAELKLSLFGTVGMVILNKLIKESAYPLLYAVSSHKGNEEKRIERA